MKFSPALTGRLGAVLTKDSCAVLLRFTEILPALLAVLGSASAGGNSMTPTFSTGPVAPAATTAVKRMIGISVKLPPV
ncbi:hypothetical protein D3C71_1966320 [compost metagenome]